MKNNPDKHHRRSIRLKGYDYSQPGAYFITICTHDRQWLFGHIVNGKMKLNALGKIAHQCWLAIPDHFPRTRLDEFVIMPNHVHGIIWIVDDPNRENVVVKNVGAKNVSPLRPRGTSRTIGSIVRGFKIGVTKWARQHTNVYHVWQRNYYEHIIRNDNELNRIREYIINNPLIWARDNENFTPNGIL
ncbi:MAG: hypothetical protein GXO78_14235 [Calditrichaeota bacterium]|nr:hypothetical protein [Calditrichota bacterium]